MIYDSIKNILTYKGLSENMDKAIDFLASFDESKYADGRYEIEGDEVFFMVQTNALASREETRFEAHNRYADIQFALTDGEEIGYAVSDTLVWAEDYPERDIKFTLPIASGVPLSMKKGMFAVFYPHDAHAPGRKESESDSCRKVVVKVKL